MSAVTTRTSAASESSASTARATFYVQATPATRYLRCELPARYLPGVVLEDFELAYSDEGAVRFPEHQGAAIFQFPADKMRALALANMRVLGIRTLIEVDDNYLINPGRAILTRSQWGMRIGDMPNTRQGHRWIVGEADGVLVTTEALASAYRKLNHNVFICPNTVDPGDWPEPKKPDDGVFRIAWIASRSHDVDIPLVTRAFEWASRQPDVKVYAAGLDPLWKFPYSFIPWLEDLADYRKLFQMFDVGVAPIRGLPFAMYRSDVKALEYAMGLCCPVLSDVAPYAGWRDKPCLMAKDAKGFLRAIQHLVSNREEARQLASEAREYVLRERTTEAQIGLWREAVEE